MKRKGLLFMALTLILCVLSLCFIACSSDKPCEHQTDDSGFCVSCDEAISPTVGILYKVSDDETYAEVVGYDGSSTKMNIASTYKNLPVKIICDRVFYNKKFTKVIIPDSVTRIGISAFSRCEDLQIVTFGENSQLEIIHDEAFRNCYSLESIQVPSGVISIGYEAFFYCSSLQSITVAEDNNSYKSIDGNLYSKDGKVLIQYAIGNPATSLTILDTVTTIGTEAFYLSKNLQTVIFGENSQLESIEDQAFYNCRLQTINLPNTVKNIGNEAFYNCLRLQRIEIPSSVISIGDYAFWSCESLECNVKDGLNYIGNPDNKYLYLVDRASSYITSATIDNGCKFIGSSAFWNCEILESITIPSSVTSIGRGAFDECYSLKTVEIANGVTSIGERAFWNCSSLESIEIPSSVKSIGEWAFRDCDILKSVTFGANSKLETIGDEAFRNCPGLETIEIPYSVTNIGRYAFSGCYNLREVEISSSVQSIGEKAFSGCYILQSVSFGTNSKLESIGDDTFYNCPSLYNVTFGGTKAQWNSAIKNTVIGYYRKVVCSDGTING